jgi:ribosomal protein S18 acetylase RimI-like enzyme
LKSSEVQIRRLTGSDAHAYRALRLRAFRDYPEAFTSSFEEESLKPLANSEQRLSESSSCRVWGAFVENRLVGMVGLEREQRQKIRHKGLIIGMYVAPEFARRGIARTLLNTLLEHARQIDLELLVLTVTCGNEAAERLYHETGFKSWGIEPGAIKLHDQRFDKNHLYLHL